MDKKEQMLIIKPDQELKFRGKFIIMISILFFPFCRSFCWRFVHMCVALLMWRIAMTDLSLFMLKYVYSSYMCQWRKWQIKTLFSYVGMEHLSEKICGQECRRIVHFILNTPKFDRLYRHFSLFEKTWFLRINFYAPLIAASLKIYLSGLASCSCFAL